MDQNFYSINSDASDESASSTSDEDSENEEAEEDKESNSEEDEDDGLSDVIQLSETDSPSQPSLDKYGNPKKRVTFMDDDQLCSFLEIPPRMYSPMWEELKPCDPDTLALEFQDVKLVTSENKKIRKTSSATSYRRPRSRTPTFNSRPQSAGYTGRKGNNNNIKMIHKDNKLEKPKPTKISPAVERLYGTRIKDNIRLTKPSPFTKTAPLAKGVRNENPRRRTASLPVAQTFSSRDKGGNNSFSSPSFQNRTNKDSVFTNPNRNSVDKTLTQSQQNGRPVHSQSANLETMRARNSLTTQRISLDTKQLYRGHGGTITYSCPSALSGLIGTNSNNASVHVPSGATSSSSCTALQNTSSGFQTQARVHPSPYRQSSLPNGSSTSAISLRSSQTYPGLLRERSFTSSYHDKLDSSHSNRMGVSHSAGATRVSPRKVVAWHMANSHLPNFDTPCTITPMFENTKNGFSDTL